MIDAALSGVDVHFMMTGMPDKKVALLAAQTYYPKLLDAGARHLPATTPDSSTPRRCRRDGASRSER